MANCLWCSGDIHQHKIGWFYCSIECSNADRNNVKFAKRNLPMKLEVTQEKVVAAAATCPDAARILKELFPEAFKKEEPTKVLSLLPGEHQIRGGRRDKTLVGSS